MVSLTDLIKTVAVPTKQKRPTISGGFALSSIAAKGLADATSKKKTETAKLVQPAVPQSGMKPPVYHDDLEKLKPLAQDRKKPIIVNDVTPAIGSTWKPGVKTPTKDITLRNGKVVRITAEEAATLEKLAAGIPTASARGPRDEFLKTGNYSAYLSAIQSKVDQKSALDQMSPAAQAAAKIAAIVPGVSDSAAISLGSQLSAIPKPTSAEETESPISIGVVVTAIGVAILLIIATRK